MNNQEHLTEKDLIEFQFKLADEQRSAEIAEHLQNCSECEKNLQKLQRKFASLELLRQETKASEELVAQAISNAKTPSKHKNFILRPPVWLSAAAVLLLGLVLLVALPENNKNKRNAVNIEMKKELADTESPDSTTTEDMSFAIEQNGQETLVARDLDTYYDDFDSDLRPNDTTAGFRQMTAPENAAEDEDTDAVDRIVARSEEVSGGDELVRGMRGDRGGFAGGMGGARGGIGGRGTITESLEEMSSRQPTRESEIQVAESSIASISEPIESDLALIEEQDIFEKPPFAPASAIELVILPKRENVQLTIYNSADLTLVREKRNLTLKRGWNWLQFMWENTLIDPTSLSLEPVEQRDQIDIQQLVFPAGLRQIGRWLIRSEVSGRVPFEITYLTSGLSWRAFYMGTLSEDEKSMEMEGYVRVTNNSGEDYEDAQTRLIVGQVHMLDEIAELAQKQYPYDSPLQSTHNILFMSDRDWGMINEDTRVPLLGDMPEVASRFQASSDRKEIIKEGLSEYFLYTIEGTETIENQWSKRLLSLEANDIEVDSLYKYDESRWGSDTIRFVKFANDPNHNLGETPIPDGDVKIYGLADANGYLSYVGGTSIKYIPVNEEVELNLGSARLVEVTPTLMDYRTDNYMFDPNENISGWDEIRTWEIEITNAKIIPVDIEITRDFGTPYWTLESDITYDKYDMDRARFEMTIEPRTVYEFDYTVTTYHEDRQEQFNQ